MHSGLHKSNFPAGIEAYREKANNALAHSFMHFQNGLGLVFFSISEQFGAISK